MSTTQENIQANIDGNVSGQIAIGSYILQVGDVNGGVVNIAPPAAQAGFEPRTRPISLRPRPFPGLLDRTQETEIIKAAIAAAKPITVFGENGIGKTSLLRQITHLTELKEFADGVFYLLLHNEEIEDLLQTIFDAFLVSSNAQKPTDGQLRNDLKEIHALIILDDISLKREDVSILLDAMPQSLFILASLERSLWGEGQAVPLDGLPEAEALQLFERELGRALTDDERPAAIQICTVLLFHPLRILQAASMIREEGLSILETFSRLTRTRTQSPVLEVALKNSNETQKKILSMLAVAGGFMLTREHLVALTSSATFDADMKSLIGGGFVQAEGSGFSLSSEALSSLSQIWDLSGWEDALLNHFSSWLKTSPQDMLIDQVADTLFHLIKRAGEKKDWPQVVTLGRVLERFYLLKKKWQGWLKILELLRLAAKALADRKLEGWVLHQMGSRAMSMGVKETAQEFFKQALNIRHAIGDKAGLAVTQHNMSVLSGLPVPLRSAKSSSLRRWLTCGAISGAAGLLFVTAAVGATMLFPLIIPTDTPTPTVTASRTRPPTPTENILTPSLTPTLTLTPRPTPVVLFDFVEDAILARWEAIIPNPDGASLVDLTFYNVTPLPSSEDFANENESSHVGVQEFPLLEDNSKRDDLVLVTYPYYGSLVRGTYSVFETRLQSGDRFVAQVGYKKLPAEVEINSIYVTYSVYFYEKDPASRVLIGELVDFYDGKVQEWIVPIPKTLVGKRGFFVLEASTISYDRYDWAVWIDAALVGLPR
jgi:hypothetical protein